MQSRSGLTLLELLIVVAILGILAVVAFAGLLNTRKQAQYAAATMLLNNLAQELTICLIDNGDFPADTTPNRPPAECPDMTWPSQNDIPFNSTIDYENWVVDGNRWIGITFWGEANNRAGIPSFSNLGSGFKRHKTASNLTFSLALETP